MAGAPALGFHWGGVVASSIMIEPSGIISIYNNPGTAYETFRAGTIYGAGDIVAYYSDKRLKENLTPLTDALAKVSSLNAYTYTTNELGKTLMNDSDNSFKVGLIAQELQSVLPEAVKMAPFDTQVLEDGTKVSKSGENYLTIQYEKVVPLLVEAIKELSAKVDALSK
jgi:hypothetical protein